MSVVVQVVQGVYQVVQAIHQLLSDPSVDVVISTVVAYHVSRKDASPNPTRGSPQKKNSFVKYLVIN